MSIFFPKAAAPAPLEQVATQGGEPNVVRVVNIVYHQYRLFFIAKIPIRPLWCESMGSFYVGYSANNVEKYWYYFLGMTGGGFILSRNYFFAAWWLSLRMIAPHICVEECSITNRTKFQNFNWDMSQRAGLWYWCFNGAIHLWIQNSSWTTSGLPNIVSDLAKVTAS